MQLGIQLAHLGPRADASSIRTAATSADVLGYHSLWAVDPALARTVTGSEVAHPAGLEPITALTYAAACTEHVQLGLHLRVRPAEVLTRAVDALDALSLDRLVLAVEVGGADRADVGAVLDTLRRPRRPLLVSSGLGPDAVTELVRSADGWMAMRLPLDAVGTTWSGVLAAAGAAGRDPADLRLVVRADVELAERPLGRHRSTFCGSVGQVVDDLIAVQGIGAASVVLALVGDLDLDAVLGGYAAIAEGVELRAPR